MNHSKKYIFKIVVVGDGGIGKSTMIQRLITGKYIEQKITIGTDLASWNIDMGDSVIKLQIWDFAGEKRFRFFLPNYSRGANGCLLCYDITRYTSFQNLQEWYDIIKNNASNPIFVLVGGKADLADSRRTVQFEDAEKFQKQHDIPYLFETSSKSGNNNKEIFETITKLILKKRNII
ncbi:MAG: GTP-binding protein [Promethearchaeota archaeon]